MGGAGAGSEASSSTSAPAGSLRLQGSYKIFVHGDELFREPFHHERELGNGGVITGRGCCQVSDGIHRLLL